MNSYTIQDLTIADSLDLLQEFVANLGDAANTFRYFSNRELSIVRSHLVSILIIENDTAIAYGHLEKEGDTVWLGICVQPQYQGRKLGNLVMQELISMAKQKSISKISLTVDLQNLKAIKFYENFGFTKINTTEKYLKYKLTLS